MNTKRLKRLLLLPLLMLGLLIGLAAQSPSGNVVLAFDYPVSDLDTNLVFKLYGTTNVALPLTNWLVMASAAATSAVSTNLIGTNLVATFNIPVTITPGRFFFVCTASNFWQESVPSNVASTPALPRSDSKLTIKRGP